MAIAGIAAAAALSMPAVAQAAPAIPSAQAAPLVEQPIKDVGLTGIQWKNNGSGAAISLTSSGSVYAYETTHNDALVAGDGSCATWIQGAPMEQKPCNNSEAQDFAWTSGDDIANEGASLYLGTGACIVPIMGNTRLGAVACPGQPIPSADKWEW